MLRLLATTALAGVGVLFAPSALAQPVTFSDPLSSPLVQPVGSFNRLETGAPTTLTIEVPESVSATVMVDAPTFEGGPNSDPGGTVRTATVTFPGGIATSEGGPVPLPTGTTELSVSMVVERPAGSVFSPGIYSYQVLITVTTTPP